MKHFLVARFPLWSLGVLFAIELFASYDTVARQAVLALSALAALAIFLVVERSLAKNQGVLLPPAVAWLAAIGVWFDAAGNFAHLYARILYWDRIAHLVGAFALAAALTIVLAAFEQQGKIRLGAFGLSLFAICITVTLAALYESTEFIGDRLFDTHRVTDLYDTADDLMWNLGGAVIGAWGAGVFRKR